LARKGSDINTRFCAALPCCLAFRGGVRFVWITGDARTDIRAAISRFDVRRRFGLAAYVIIGNATA
jgi:hypothetical protein